MSEMHPTPTDSLDTGNLGDLAAQCPDVLASAAMAHPQVLISVPDGASDLVEEMYFV
ncbi:hypothetical protein [Janibacter sp. GXQ6167]|uniref:hypothetical protein n=1 Tax=Janibacter sp. GXQ6167 TaxID=3240791 RepID=UPI0035258269